MSISKLLVAPLLYFISTVAVAEWTPTEPINPSDVLNSARQDRASGEYESALQKHLWYHHNALKHDRSLYGVRLSFALSDWGDLASKYPPALTALLEEREIAEGKARDGVDGYSDAFHDFAAINRQFDEHEPVVQLFKYLDRELPESAKKNVRSARLSLIKSKDYALYTKYLDPEAEIERIQASYLLELELYAGARYEDDLKEAAHDSYIERVTTLVAVLSVTGDDVQAKKMYDKALEKMDTQELRENLDRALAGEVPELRA